jgi:hypothetical protein
MADKKQNPAKTAYMTPVTSIGVVLGFVAIIIVIGFLLSQ